MMEGHAVQRKSVYQLLKLRRMSREVENNIEMELDDTTFMIAKIFNDSTEE
jgi:hypothetical protein